MKFIEKKRDFGISTRLAMIFILIILCLISFMTTVLYRFFLDRAQETVQSSVQNAIYTKTESLRALISQIETASTLLCDGNKIYVYQASAPNLYRMLRNYDKNGQVSEAVEEYRRMEETLESYFHFLDAYGVSCSYALYIDENWKFAQKLRPIDGENAMENTRGIYSAREVSDETWYQTAIMYRGSPCWFSRGEQSGRLYMSKLLYCRVLEGNSFETYLLGVLSVGIDVSWIARQLNQDASVGTSYVAIRNRENRILYANESLPESIVLPGAVDSPEKNGEQGEWIAADLPLSEELSAVMVMPTEYLYILGSRWIYSCKNLDFEPQKNRNGKGKPCRIMRGGVGKRERQDNPKKDGDEDNCIRRKEELEQERYMDKIWGCWLGKCLGGAIGMPFEGVPFPVFLKEEDIFIRDVPNDDLELQLVWMDAIRRYGTELTSRKLADSWLNKIQHGCDEYSIAIHNMKHGILPPASGWHNNFFADGMGAVIRSEIWALLFAGRPDAAGYFACQDAQADHWGNGVWGEIFMAEAEAYACVHSNIEEALCFALGRLDHHSRLYQTISKVYQRYVCGMEEERARELLMRQEQRISNFTDCVMNLSFIVHSLLYGGGDFLKTILTAISFGRDTDCTGASCGAFLGIALGKKAIPEKWASKVKNDG